MNCERVTLEKLSFGASGADFIVKIDPNDDLTPDEVGDLIEYFKASVYVRSDNEERKNSSEKPNDSGKADSDGSGFIRLCCILAVSHNLDDITVAAPKNSQTACIRLMITIFIFWLNPIYPNADVDMLNEQKYFHFKAK